MELLIKVDERAYKKCVELKSSDDMGVLGFHLINASANGTPLPKGHGDLIDIQPLMRGLKVYKIGMNLYPN